jgi:hypothetical protein
MSERSGNDSSRLDTVIAILIAIVSMTLAVGSWRISNLSSDSGDATRQGMLDAVKKQASANESWRMTYQEAGYAESYAAFQAEIQALEASQNSEAAAQAANLKKYMLPSLQLLGGDLLSDKTYQKPDGTYDLQKRFDALQAASPDLTALDPQKSFKLGDQYNAEMRWLTVAIVLLAVSLFWLALAEVGGKRMRLPTLAIGAVVFLLGIGMTFVVEVVFFFMRGGAL